MRVRSTIIMLVCLVAGLSPALANHCVVPDNGTGTADFPPSCVAGYRNTSPYVILNGLPPGDSIESTGPLHNFFIFSSGPGGSLGGSIQQWDAFLSLGMKGSGSLSGFSRFIDIPVVGVSSTGPTVPGDPNQSYSTELEQLQGQLPPGDPDFDLLRITAGTAFGMPSPGHTLLETNPGPVQSWRVDSFFDITYRIDFIGAPGGALSGMSGSTTGTVHVEIPYVDLAAGEDHWATLGGSQIDIGSDVPPLPAGFLYPGSPSFAGVVPMVGVPRKPDLSNADTIVRRLAPASLPVIGSTATIPIEIVSLDLRSASPIDVGGVFFDVGLRLDPAGLHTGSMTITRGSASGGTFSSSFQVQPVFTFTPVAGGPSVTYAGLPAVPYSTSCDHTWSEAPPLFPPSGAGPGFWAGPEPHLTPSGVSGIPLITTIAADTQPFTLCVMPDNGAGTADFPPACPGGLPNDPNQPNGFDILNGLPAGATLDGDGTLLGFILGAVFPGGSLGGEVQQFTGDLRLTLTGTGPLAGYLRTLTIPHIFETHTAPRPPFFPVQDFQTDLARMQGQLPPGDPDFDLLRVTAGTAFGLPGPGHTTFAQRPDGRWAVDSFFDITYRIDFVGRPGGPFSGMSGSTVAVTRVATPPLLWHPMGECLVPDAGGSADMPAICGSGYGSSPDSIVITAGVPPGSSLQVTPELSSVDIVAVAPGGSLGGDVTLFNGAFRTRIVGTGALAGFARRISIPVSGENHNGPKMPGATQQSFPMDLAGLQGQISGDPDFDLLRITAGTSFGLPGPGQTFIKTNPGPIQTWAVDSFFDITYRIDYVGAPGGPLAGMSGSEVGRVRLQAGLPSIPMGDDPWATVPQTLICFGCGTMPPIPAGFLYPGSPAFSGAISMQGLPFDGLESDADTLIRRLADTHLPTVGAVETIPIEMLELSLVSVSPITPDGVNFFDVFMTLEPGTTSGGRMNLVRGTPEGGGFLTSIDQVERITLRAVGGGPPLVLPGMSPRGVRGVCQHPWFGSNRGTFSFPHILDGSFVWEAPPYLARDAAGLPHSWLQARRAIGACCMPSGACQDVTARQCVSSSGLPQGAGSFCLGDANGDLIDDKCSAALPPEVSPQGAPIPFHAQIAPGGQLHLTWQSTLGAAAYHLFAADPASLRVFGGFNMTTASPMGCGLAGVSIVMPMPAGNLAISVAADNAVGTGPIGYASNGTPRTAVPCP